MRTTLNIDKEVLDSVVNLTGEKSKSKAVSAALKEYVRWIKIDELREAAGKFQIDDTRAEQREADERRQAFLDKLRNG